MESEGNRARFWMCWVEDEGPPKLKHWSKTEAMHEAERLAQLTHRDVFLLEASNFVKYIPPIPRPTLKWEETII